MIPILHAHDVDKPIGHMSMDGDRLQVVFKPGSGVTREVFYAAFGGAGWRLLEEEIVDGRSHILRVEILEFSIWP